MTDTETIALLSQVIAETAEELGCENDNEAILQAIHDLKQRASLPSPPVSGERTPWLKHAQIRAVTEPRVDHTVHSVELVFETGEQSISAFMALNALKFGEAPLTNEPVGWSYDRAYGKNAEGDWCKWGEELTKWKPTDNDGSIRDLNPLYTIDRLSAAIGERG